MITVSSALAALLFMMLVPKIQLQCCLCVLRDLWLCSWDPGWSAAAAVVAADVSCGQRTWLLDVKNLSIRCALAPFFFEKKCTSRSKYNINDEEVIGRSIFTTSFYFPLASWEVSLSLLPACRASIHHKICKLGTIFPWRQELGSYHSLSIVDMTQKTRWFTVPSSCHLLSCVTVKK